MNILLILHFLVQLLLLATLYYWLLRLLKGTPGLSQIVTIFVTLAVLTLLTNYLELETLRWILGKILDMLPLIILVLYQTEIRRIIGIVAKKLHLRLTPLKRDKTVIDDEFIEVLCTSITNLHATKTGALIALELGMSLQTYCDKGKRLNAMLMPYNGLLENIFYKGAPMHDGGVIIINGRLEAAACAFPHCENSIVQANFGLRHQGATGLSEKTDAIVLVVSEETGDVHFVKNGQMTLIDPNNILKELSDKLKTTLPKEFLSDAGASLSWRKRIKAFWKFMTHHKDYSN